MLKSLKSDSYMPGLPRNQDSTMTKNPEITSQAVERWLAQNGFYQTSQRVGVQEATFLLEALRAFEQRGHAVRLHIPQVVRSGNPTSLSGLLALWEIAGPCLVDHRQMAWPLFE